MNQRSTVRVALIATVVMAACIDLSCSSSDCAETANCDAPTPVDGADGGDAGGIGSETGGPGGDAAVPSFEMTATAPPTITVGTSADIDVSVVRTGAKGVAGAIKVVVDPQSGITAAPLVIAATESTGKLSVSVAADRKHGTITLGIHGTTDANESKGEAKPSTVIRGLPGALDTSFGVDGIFTFDKADSVATGVVIQTDEKIVFGGRAGTDLAVVRLSKDGVIDTSFNAGLTTIKPPGNGVLTTADLVSDKNGSLSLLFSATIAGSITPSAFVIRLSTNGATDASFGVGGTGIVTVNLLKGSTLAVGADASLFVGGRNPNDSYGQYVVKLKPDGVPDGNWGANGVFTKANNCVVNPANCYTHALIVEPSGKVVASQARNDGAYVQRITTTGTLGNLDVSTSLQIDQCEALAADPTSAEFVFVGGLNTDLSVLKLDAAGSPVTPWGNGNFGFDAPPASGLKVARRLAVSKGKIVVASEADLGGGAFGITRLTPLGALDTTFTSAGYVKLKVDSKATTTKTMIIDSLDRIVVAGTNGNMVAARFWQ